MCDMERSVNLHESVATLMQGFFIQDCMFQDTTVNCVSPGHYNVTTARSLEVNAVINCTLKSYKNYAVCVTLCFWLLGRPKPGWGKDNLNSVWWPHQITFTDVNNNPLSKRKDLLVIMQHHRDWKERQLVCCSNHDHVVMSEKPVPVSPGIPLN